MEVVQVLEKAFKEISNLIRSQNSISLSCHTLSNNNSGDDVKKLDIISNTILMNLLMNCESVRKIGSEEEELLFDTKYTDAP